MSNVPFFAISPIHTTSDFPNGLTLENKIDIFSARIEGWQIGITKEIIKKAIPHREFAILHIVFSYFEMIRKYQHGYVDNYQSKHYFYEGVRITFPEISSDEETFLELLYSNVKNGLYHLGITKMNVILCGDIPGSIGCNPEMKILMISPDQLVEDLVFRFHYFITELRNTNNLQLRENFEKRFDFDNS